MNSIKPLRFRYLLGLGVLVAGASMAQPLTVPDYGALHGGTNAEPSDLSVLTYNVRGLPWPVARGREPALQAIASRLRQMRTIGRQPSVVVLQEAFTREAKLIGERAGYRNSVFGPDGRNALGPRQSQGRKWYLGETQAPVLDSGLVLLSDYPIVDVVRQSFPAEACAGYDCLSAKGVLLVTLEIPGKGRVSIATTHFNSRGASGAPLQKTRAAYARQAAFLSDFIAGNSDAGIPLVLAGDFNRGARPYREDRLDAALRGMYRQPPPQEALRYLMSGEKKGITASQDANWIRMRARDMQFPFEGKDRQLVPTALEIPFGTAADGSRLSDHLGFTVHYQMKEPGPIRTVEPRPPHPARESPI